MAEMTREQALDALRELEYWAKGNRVILQDKHYKALGVAIAALRCRENCTQSATNNPHIKPAPKPTFGIDAFDCFMEQAFGLKRAKSGSETAPNTVSPNGSPVLGDNTNGIKPGSVTNQPKTTDWKPRKPRLNATRILV